ncbi:MAG TPA: UDP-N-acetylglucosamine pyrophosphorylase [Smithella sp.]|nr:UDP-N-acetylglucosamine pyrophosphorylase [Smithella sp.]HNY50948.1 UDP-N-acetylglucosamine pyrophosphorylase [Smithella sp.]HOG91264.1 UDP-N-acetylglucosamine pyrophosphorylase [Smithella sp.]
MDSKPKINQKLSKLIKKGVDIPLPQTVYIHDDVHVDQISGKNVKIYPGCRIYGSKTVISSGCKLGYEAPVTLEDCRLAQDVELKGGYFSKSVFLEKSNMGMGAHVREGCLLEEEAGGAHSVGLKQTILFPFVTLGSLINFCDCFMAGGTSRRNHSEVGSSYIHFNFTPDGDKATPSLIGDVPRGVMLNQPPIFLGGQGGMVGPIRLGYGNVVAAGSILRKDCPQDHQLIFDMQQIRGIRNFKPAAYPNLRRILENNILYLANINALQAWYKNIRKPFFEAREFGALVYAGAVDLLASAREERLKRLRTMAQKAVDQSPQKLKSTEIKQRQAFLENTGKIEELLNKNIGDTKMNKTEEIFVRAFEHFCDKDGKSYIETIQNLPPSISTKGVRWLQEIVNYYCESISTVIPSLKLFGTK